MLTPYRKHLTPTRSDLIARAKTKLDASRVHSEVATLRVRSEDGETLDVAGADEPYALFVRGSDKSLSRAERLDLLKQARAGEPIELEMVATVYIQRPTPNRNFVRHKPGVMAKLAKSYTGMPFLRNHGHEDQQDRGGTIISSKLQHLDNGDKAFEQRFRLVKQWAVESALDGTLDQFSIAWHRLAPSDCSICDAAWVQCEHWPGEMYDGQVCELIVTSSEGTETSYVNVPAVTGTAPVSISQLEALDPALLADILAAHEEIHAMTLAARLAALLALTATATDDDVFAAVTAQRDELQSTRDRLTIAETTGADVKTRLASLEVEQAERARASRVVTVDAGITQLIAAGKVKPGSETELALRRQGGVTKDAAGKLTIDMTKPLDLFEASVKDILATGPVVTPVGAALPATHPDPQPAAPSDTKVYLSTNPAAAAMLKAAGPDVLAHFEKNGADTATVAAAKFAK